MASFVHIAPASAADAIRRSGIAASRYTRGVFCYPVLPDFFATHQWMHELRRRSRERRCGVYFRVPDTQVVRVGHFKGPHEEMTAAEVVARLRTSEVLGVEIIIPRPITRSEIRRIKALPQLTGWRMYPEAKGARSLWPYKGEYRAARLREIIEDRNTIKNAEAYFAGFPPEWYADE